LGFKYEKERNQAGMTALAGLPLYLELASVLKLRERLDQEVGVRAEGQGWTDSQVGMALIFLNLAGGSCVEDLKQLKRMKGSVRCCGGWSGLDWGGAAAAGAALAEAEAAGGALALGGVSLFGGLS
jgi:hypothetical protein